MRIARRVRELAAHLNNERPERTFVHCVDTMYRLQTGTFTMIEVCEEYFQRAVVICYATEAGQNFANISWQFVAV